MAVISGHVDGYMPRLSLLVNAASHHFATDFNQITAHAIASEHFAHLVACQSLGYAAEVELSSLVVSHDTRPLETCFAQPDELHDAIDLGRCGRNTTLVAEPPGVDKRHNSGVERPVALAVHSLGRLKEPAKTRVGRVALTRIDSPQERLTVKRRYASIHSREYGRNRVGYPRIAHSSECDVIFRGPHFAAYRVVLFAVTHKVDYHHGSYQNQ